MTDLTPEVGMGSAEAQREDRRIREQALRNTALARPEARYQRGQITAEELALQEGRSGDQYQRALSTPAGRRQLESRMTLDYEELLDLQRELEETREYIRQNQDSITEQMAATMSRAYLANPSLNPEIIVSAVFGGADEATIYRMATEAAAAQFELGDYGSDTWEDFSKNYPWLTGLKKELVDSLYSLPNDETQPISKEWWESQTNSRWHSMLGGRDPKSLGPLAQKVSQEELDRRYVSPETNFARQIWDWVTRAGAPSQQPGTLGVVEEVGEVAEGSRLIPNVAMVSSIDLLDTALAPFRWTLDKVTPDKISDPVSDWMRGATRYGFSAAQLLLDLPENIVMAATADPEQAHLGFRAEIGEKGVLEGLGAGLANAWYATSFGQATRQLYSDEEIDTGSGFFMGGKAQEEADKLKMYTVGFYSDDEGNFLRNRSFGTASAEFMSQIEIVNQDDFMYNIISGGIDGAFELFADPTNYIPFAGWGDETIAGLKAVNSRTARKVGDLLEESRRLELRAVNETNPAVADSLRAMSDDFARQALEQVGINTASLDRAAVRARLNRTSDQIAAARSVLLDEAGVIRAGNKRTVVMPEFAKFLIRGRGQRLVRELQTETSPTRIKELFRYKIGTTTAVALSRADTPEDVIRILVQGISNPKAEFASTIQMVPHVGLFSLSDKGLWIRRQLSPITRLGNLLPPGTILNPQDADEMVLNLRQIFDVLPTDMEGFKIARYDQEFKRRMLDQLMVAFADGDMGGVKKTVGEVAKRFEDTFVAMGYPPHVARELTRYVQNSDRLSAFRWADYFSDSGPIDKNIVSINDLLSSGIMIIDTNRFLEIVRRSGRVRSQMRQWSSLNPEIRRLEETRVKYLELRRAGKDDEAEKLIDEILDRQEKISRKTPKSAADEFDRGAAHWLALRGENLHDFWKTFTIARAAYPLRVVPEETGRVLLSGVFRRWTDYVATVISSSEKMNLAGKGRYLSDAANRRFVRKTRRMEELQVQYDIEQEFLDDLVSRGLGSSPEAQAVRNKLDEIDALFIKEHEAWDRSLDNFGKVQIGNDRDKATRTVTRRRAKRAIASQSTAVANRNLQPQVQQWVDGVIERVVKLSTDEQGAVQIARAAVGYDIAKANPFEFNGVMGTVKQHLDRGENFEEVMAQYFVAGYGRPGWQKFARALTSDGTPTNPDSFDDALRFVKDQIREIEYVVGRSPNSAYLPNMSPSPFGNADPDLLRAVATGKFAGRPLQSTVGASLKNRNARWVFNQKFRDHVELWGLNPNAPDKVLYTTQMMVGEDEIRGMEQFANFIFGQLYGSSSDILARSPAWRRLYWKQVANVIRSATPEAADIILQNARKAKVDKALMKKLETNAKFGVGELDVDDIDDFARGAATGLTKDLLFDATRKGATADALRLVVAFGDAWYEVMKTWTRLNLDRKGMPIKSLMKGIGGGRDFSLFGSMTPSSTFEYDPETGQYNKISTQKRAGFVYQDPTTGQEMFGLPMSNKLLRAGVGLMLGQDPGPYGELRAPLEGLNVFGTVSPGVGPYGSVLAQMAIPKTPNFDWLRDVLYPYGAPQEAGEQATADVGVARYFPPYIRRALITGAETIPGFNVITDTLYNYQRDPTFMNLQINIAKSLMTSGNYEDSVEGSRRLQEDVRKAAAFHLGIWALASFVGPAAPSFQPLYETRDPETGEVMASVTAYLYADELNALRKLYIDTGEDPNQASIDMAYTYGPYMWLANIPNSNTEYPGQEQTQQWWDWYRTGNNREFLRTFKTVGAFFGAVNGERDNDVANQMRQAGLTPPKTVPELVEDGQRLLAYQRLDQWLQTNGLAGPEAKRTPDQRVAIALYKRELEEYYRVNFEDTESKDRRTDQFNELGRMMTLLREGDPLVAEQLNTDFGKRVQIYMNVREGVIADWTKLSGLSPESWVSSRAAAPLRDSLRSLGVTLSQQDPGFARLYEFVLRNEMLDVDDEAREEVEIRFGRRR